MSLFSKKSAAPSVPSNAPLTAFEQARIEWFERYGSAIVDKNRAYVLTVLLAAAVFAMGYALASIAPLKTVVPYVIKVAESGVATPLNAAAQGYQPGEAERRYFLAQWVNKVLTLDPFLTDRNLIEASGLTRGKAIKELTDWVKVEKPFEAVRTDQSLTRVVQINTVSFLNDGVALVRVSTETRSLNKSASTKRYMVTIHYAVVPPLTEAEIYKNPVGLFVTHFSIQEELA